MYKADATQTVIALCGCGLCLLGLLKWPKASFELIAPRFVIPAMFLLGLFLDFFYWSFHTEAYQYEDRIYGEATTALLYLCTCVMGFWIGFYSPIGAFLARKATPLHVEITLPDNVLYTFSWIMAISITTIAFSVSGGAYIDETRLSSQNFWGVVKLKWLAVMVNLMMILGAVAVGMCWPEEGRWPRRAMMLFLLVVIGLPNFAKFSRGAGLVYVVAALSFCIRYRRFAWLGLSSAALTAVVGGAAGLSGRSIYGHYAGFVPFLGHMFTTVGDSLSVSTDVVAAAIGKFTVTSIVIDASHNDIRQSPWWEWVWFQLPVPRPLGLTPTDVGISVKDEIGGARGWTPSMFGDVWGHLGWLGFLAFIPIGLIARFVESLALRPLILGKSGLNIAVMLAPLTYMAMMLGFHNTYRSFVVSFFYPLYLMVGGIVFLRMLGTSVQFHRAPAHTIR